MGSEAAAMKRGEAVDWHGRRVAVVGLGISNMAVVRRLATLGARIVGFDQKSGETMGSETVRRLHEKGVELVLGPDYLERLVESFDWDAVFLTPGMPKTSPPLEKLREADIPFHSEIGLFFSLCRAPIVGITGSSGKTTTTTLLGEMLRRGPRPVYVGGNIGTPLLDVVDDIGPDARVVVELSSFQLELLEQSPWGAVVTNVTPNHLDVHGTMEAYTGAKRRILQFQSLGDWALLNGDDETTTAMMREARGEAMTFSTRRPASAWVEKGYVVVEGGPGGNRLAVCAVADIALPGRHNVENVLAAAAAAARCGASAAAIRAVATTFRGVPHRLEFVAELDGVRYYNDSIATSPARAVAGVQAFEQPVVLIAGGYDKQLPFEQLAATLPGRVRTAVLLGATAPAIADAIERQRGLAPLPGPDVVRATGFEEAVRLARAAARPGDVVLLSPASASYDMFPNFEARGELFREIVRGFSDRRDEGDEAKDVGVGHPQQRQGN